MYLKYSRSKYHFVLVEIGINSDLVAELSNEKNKRESFHK